MKPSQYARSGVDTSEADRALSRLLLEVSPTQAFGAPSELGVGHFAAVIRVGPVHLALTTDGVGTKLLVAQQMGRYDKIGIDCPHERTLKRLKDGHRRQKPWLFLQRPPLAGGFEQPCKHDSPCWLRQR